MVSVRKALLYGLLAWVIPFAVSFLVFPLRESWRALFESIMPVAVAMTVAALSVSYFRGVRAKGVREGVLLGLIWLGISLAIDLLMFSGGPMKMGLGEYMADIGLTYVMIPAITIAIGAAWALNGQREGEA